MENFCSEFIKDLGFFGKYPTNEELQILEDKGIDVIIDLTNSKENLPPYTFSKEKIHFPIEDRRVPQDNENFRSLLNLIIVRLNEGHKVYIHCKGGHGRSGLLVALLLRLMYDYNAEKALSLTHEFHQQRKIIKPRFRKMGSPQTRSQKDFVKNFIV